jgi:hypothetical protein
MHKTVPSRYALHCRTNILATSLCTGIFYVNYARSAEKCSKRQKSVSGIRECVIRVAGVTRVVPLYCLLYRRAACLRYRIVNFELVF